METLTQSLSNISQASLNDAGTVIGACDICKRSTVPIKQYGFGVKKKVINWGDKRNPISDNPDALSIVICGTDMNLVARIKREQPDLKPREIYEFAASYREVNPIQSEG